MSDIVIQVDDLWKKYRLGVLGTGTLSHDFNRWWHRVRGKADPYAKVGEADKSNAKKLKTEKLKSEDSGSISACQDVSISAFKDGVSAFKDFSALSDDEMWALRGVSFEVKRGEILGIIGRNGAGKSTLLKILSRVTAPTRGEVRVKGRIASLLEVGTGFHPELTGRENIFLNGAILGMTKAEIRRKFDEIVDFSGVEKFLDTPVKRYSSGMYVRLAFAVAAHLEPEILIVDEVLAVGDAEFQEKCLGKMKDVAGHGRTVLFVSHNMLAVQKLCKNGLLLGKGSIRASGHIQDILDHYASTRATDVYSNMELTGEPQIMAARILTKAPRTDAPLEVMVEWVLPEDIKGIKIGIGFNTPEGQRIFDCAPEDFGLCSPDKKGRHKAFVTTPLNTLMARRYGISIGLWKNSTVFDHANPALALAVEPAPSGPFSHENNREGLVNVKCDWNIIQ
jgi:lipopolysaccharide transport system ATP-binding protein